MNEIELKQTFFLLFRHFHCLYTTLSPYSFLINIPVANNIYCLTMAEDDTQDILQIILIYRIDT